MRILFVTPEVAPFSKTGGLGDVAAALPAALAELGHRVLVASPRYRGVDPTAAAGAQTGVRYLFVENAEFFDRPGLYGQDGADYPDNDLRFASFAEAALKGAAARRFRPDLVHLHDWQAAIAAMIQRNRPVFPDAATVFTVHNLAYQGVFGVGTLARVGIPREAFTVDQLEFHGGVSFMKAGLVFADMVTTVSPRYAQEIQTPAFGHGLDGMLRARAERGELLGILNGVDYGRWSPETDALIPVHYGAARLAGKARDKRALQRTLGLDVLPDAPILGVVSRLDHQKGIDLVADIAPELTALGAQLAILGDGNRALETRLGALAARDPSSIQVRNVFDDGLAHLIQAGSDILLMPSRWEPCGLNQMYALRYGTVPVVSAVGGLVDTIEDGVTGFTFTPQRDAASTSAAFLQAARVAVGLYRADRAAWRRIVRRGMSRDHSWTSSAARYDELFRRLVGASKAARARRRR